MQFSNINSASTWKSCSVLYFSFSIFFFIVLRSIGFLMKSKYFGAIASVTYINTETVTFFERKRRKCFLQAVRTVLTCLFPSKSATHSSEPEIIPEKNQNNQ